jgi:hypothetical protein
MYNINVYNIRYNGRIIIEYMLQVSVKKSQPILSFKMKEKKNQHAAELMKIRMCRYRIIQQCFSDWIPQRGVRGSERRKCVMANEPYWRS